MDIAAAAALVAEFDEPTVAIIKHTNPCGVGSAPTLAEAYAKAFATDTKSPFGGIVAVNRPLDMEAADAINEIFTEVMIAPDFPRRRPGVPARRRRTGGWCVLTGDLRETSIGSDIRSVPGGFLVQDADPIGGAGEEFRVVTRRTPTAAEERALRFAWRVAKHVKSNAIVYARADRTLGVGAGQMSRVDSARIAAAKATDAELDLSLQGRVGRLRRVLPVRRRPARSGPRRRHGGHPARGLDPRRRGDSRRGRHTTSRWSLPASRHFRH